MKYTLNEIFKKIEMREKRLRAGSIVKINWEVSFEQLEFIDNRVVFFPPVKTTGELGKIDTVYEIDVGKEKLLDFDWKFSEKISNRIKVKVRFRMENNPNRKIYVVYLIFTYKDKVSEHYGQKDAYAILTSDDIVLANPKERELFFKREEEFVSRRIAEKL